MIPTIQLKDFCQLFQVGEREVRYILEQGHVPQGVEDHPNTGNHREFGPGPAFWLALVYKLKQAGFKTPSAAEVADVVVRGLQQTTQNLSWDWTFLPKKGWFDTDYKYFVDIGDFEYFRLLTTANPSHDGLYEFPWSRLTGRSAALRNLDPVVLLRLDLTQIASTLAKIEGWSCPHRDKPSPGSTKDGTKY